MVSYLNLLDGPAPKAGPPKWSPLLTAALSLINYYRRKQGYIKPLMTSFVMSEIWINVSL